MSGRVTAQDVADLAGVSRSAVSLVLNGRAKGTISAVKQQAVLEAARQLDYTPNVVAQSLRTSRTRNLGVLTWRGVGGLPLHLIASALQTSLNAGYMLLKMYAEPTAIDQHRALATLGKRQVDGYLVVAPELCDYEAVDAMALSPVVLLNCSDPANLYTSVVPDEEGAGARAVELLTSRGHRDIGLLSGPLTHFQTGLRVKGVQAALAAAGLPPAQTEVTEVRIDAGRSAAARLLTSERPPTALICTNERLAVGTTFAASELGLAVPADLSIVGLDDREQLSAQLWPEVTRIERPDDLMATHAAELLIERLESGTLAPPQRYSFVCPIAEGASVGPPRALV
ncbi:MAG TPA: LacI family DNA-binding transcriptional regulator [Propionibacteriaceae bacterium]